MVKQYSNLSKAEKELEMRELLYEEISNHKGQKHFKVRRESYVIIVSGNRAEIYDEKTRNKIKFG